MYSFVFLKIIKVFGKEKTKKKKKKKIKIKTKKKIIKKNKNKKIKKKKKKKKRENVKLVTNRIIGNINNNININNNKIACILKIKLLNFKNMKS